MRYIKLLKHKTDMLRPAEMNRHRNLSDLKTASKTNRIQEKPYHANTTKEEDAHWETSVSSCMPKKIKPEVDPMREARETQ